MSNPTWSRLISGHYEPTSLSKVVYGRGSIQKLPSLLDSLNAKKAYIVTGSSLQSKTPIIQEIEEVLGDKHVKTFSKIGQHAPINAIREAAEESKGDQVDVFISVGGGSPIDSVKGIRKLPDWSYMLAIIHILQKDSGGYFLPHIAIPTTLSVAGSPSILKPSLNEKPHKLQDTHRIRDTKLQLHIHPWLQG